MGDTSHIGGAKDVEGWKEGDHEHNAGLLALHEYEYVRPFFPEIDHLHLSEDSSTIIDDAGAPVSRTTLADLIVEDRHPKRLGVGETTLRRAIVTGQAAAEGRLESESETAGGLHGERRIHPGAVENFAPDSGSSAEGIDPPKHALESISYSIGHSTPSGDPPAAKSKLTAGKKAPAKKAAKKKSDSATPPSSPTSNRHPDDSLYTTDEDEIENEEGNQFKKTVRENKAVGDAREKELLEDHLPLEQTDIGPQITIRSLGPSRKKVRLDAIALGPHGEIRLTDGKASSSAPLTRNQKIVYPELETHGGNVVGKGKGIYPGGTIIPPTKVDIIIKY